MRIVINGRFITQDVTGVQRVAIEFVRALDALIGSGSLPDLGATVIAPANAPVVTDLDLKHIEVVRAGRLSGHLWEQLELPRLAGENPLLCLGNLAPLWRLRSRRRKTFVMVHDLSYEYAPQAYSRAFRALYGTVVPQVLSHATHVFTVSQSELRSILAHHPRRIDETRLTAVQNGGGETMFRPKQLLGTPGRGDRDRTCLYVGSLTRRKNARGLIESAVMLAQRGTVDFAFVGATGATFEDTDVDVPPAVADKLRFYGQINDPNRLAQFYRAAAVFVFPSYYEASPLPPVEAMSMGCPVVAADIPSLRERCGDAAVYCDPTDTSSIVHAVEMLLGDEALWNETQRRGLDRAAEFSWRTQAATVVAAIRAA